MKKTEKTVILASVEVCQSALLRAKANRLTDDDYNEVMVVLDRLKTFIKARPDEQ